MRNRAYFGTSALLTIVICILQIVRFPPQKDKFMTHSGFYYRLVLQQ